MNYLKIYFNFLKRDLKRVAMYKWDVIFGNLGFLIDSLSTLFVIFVVSSFSGTIGGWGPNEVILLYLFLNMVMAIWELFFVTTLEIPYLIQHGELDVYMARPINLLFQVITMEIDEESVAESLIYFNAFFIMLIVQTGGFNALQIIFALLYLISTLFLVEAIYLTISSFAFWTISSDGIASIYWQFIQMGEYPLSIYPKALKIVLSIIPVGFMAYFPVKNLLYFNGITFENISILFVGPLLFLLAYHTIWRFGVRRYDSFG